MSESEYAKFIELARSLQNEPSILASPKLWDLDIEQLYARMLRTLAQPLPSGEPSPFSNQAPGTAHEALVSAIVWLISLQANEFNYIPDVFLLQWMRIWGVSVRQAEFPIVSIQFDRAASAIASGVPAEVPQGLEIRSNRDSTLTATVITGGVVTGGDASITLPARVNRAGRIEVVQAGEFSVLPSLLSGIESCSNVGVISPGASEESVYDAVLRMRELLQLGNRAVTDSDIYRLALQVPGVQKINVIRGVCPEVSGLFRDLRTIVVYPGNLTELVKAQIEEFRFADERMGFYPAEIIPIDGSLQVYGTADKYGYEILNLAIAAIQNSVNPPGGVWGDQSLAATLGDALERVSGIYGTRNVNLQRADTGEPIEQLKIEPWQLLEIQSSINIEVIR